MAIAILYLRGNNEIHDYFDNVTEVQNTRVDYTDGYAEGWSSDEVSSIVTNDLTLKQDTKNNQNYLEDLQGNIYRYGDMLPEGLKDISEQFKKKSPLDLESENKQLKERLDLVESALLELTIGGV